MSDSHPLTPKPEKSGCFTVLGWVIAAGAVSIVLTALVLWRMSVMVTEETRHIAETVAANFQRALNFTPEVRVDSVVVVAASTPAFQLVTLKKQALVRHSWSHTWMHSTKALQIEATFTATAGFDLGDPLRIKIDPETKWLSTTMPPPKILSLGMSDVRIIRDEDGLWNKLTEADREQAFRGLEKEAEKEFANSNLLAEALIEGEKRIREVLKISGAQMKIESAASARE
jgi:hypothetical protein